MCLDPEYNEKTDEYGYREKPYNTSKFRWKMLLINDYEKTLTSPFQDGKWKVGKTYRAKGSGARNTDVGFHVFVTKSAAVRLACEEQGYIGCAVVKLEVSGFNAGGEYGVDKCETWKSAKIVEVWTGAGRNNITKRFI